MEYEEMTKEQLTEELLGHLSARYQLSEKLSKEREVFYQAEINMETLEGTISAHGRTINKIERHLERMP